MSCPLCLSHDEELFSQDKKRSYQLCLGCGLVFVPRSELVSLSAEKDRYESHENSETDDGYRKYLGTIASAIKAEISPFDQGLDFGSGKTKLLAELLAPNSVESFDVYFHPDESLLQKKYDFIIMSEVIEHLRDPRATMQSLRKLSGKFFIKTKWYPDKEKFSEWFYKRDITHVQFFNETSFNALGFKSWKKIGGDLYLFTE